jgi:tRNA A-37 threonylcarbamoyl transferase component Bud32
MAELPVIDGKWRIVREIGAGGMGMVYEVRHHRLPIRRALKQLKQELAEDSGIARRFDREAFMMAELEHHHIVKVHDIDFMEGFGTYILMDLVEGSDLLTILRNEGPRPYPEVLRIGSEIASALEFAHARDVVHRDIKPGNILIEVGTGRAVLTDFGIAKRSRRGTDETTDVTATQQIVGTIRYCAPEQLREEEPHPRWDIYSLGVVLYEMASGKRYLDGMSVGQIIAHVAYMPEWKPNLEFPEPEPPAEFIEVVRGCLERDPGKRIPSATELIRRLERCRAALGAALPQAAIEPERAAPPEEATAATKPWIDADLLREIRSACQSALQEIQPRDEALRVLGVQLGDALLLEDLQSRLQEVDALEAEGALREAQARLQSLHAAAVEGARQREELLRATLDGRTPEIDEQWKRLEGRAASFLPAESGNRLGAMLAEARRALGDGNWIAAAETVEGARRWLAECESRAGEHAAEAVERALQTAREQADAIGRLEPAALPEDADVEVFRERLRSRIEEGQLDAARRDAEALAARLSDALAELLAKARATAADRRREAEAARERVGRLELPGRRTREVERLLQDAARSFERHDWPEAAARYAEAAERLVALEREAGAARAATVRAEIETDLRAVRDLERDAPRLGLPPEEVLPAAESDAALAEADQLLAGGASDEGLARLDALRGQLGAARAAKEGRVRGHLEHGLAEVRERATRLAEGAGEFLAPAGRSEIERALVAAARALGDAEWPEAGRLLAAARDLVAEAETKVRERAAALTAEQDRQIEALRAELGNLLSRAGGSEAEIVGAQRAAALRALEAAASSDRAAALQALGAARDGLGRALQEAAEHAEALAGRAALQEGLERVTHLSARPRQIRPVERLRKQGERRFAHRQWAEAAAAFGEAAALAGTLEEKLATPGAVAVPRRDWRRWAGGALAASVIAALATLIYPYVTVTRVEEARAPTVAGKEPDAAPPESEVERAPQLLPAIASFEPNTDEVSIAENDRQRFSIALNDPALETAAATRWFLDDRPVETGSREWTFQPGFDAARGKPYAVRVTVGDGSGPNQTHGWTARVADTNRPPRIARALPDPAAGISSESGTKLRFEVEGADDDGDTLRYAWNVDGKPVSAKGPAFELAVTGDHRIGVKASDGNGESEPVAWRVAASKPPPLVLTARPARLEKLRFGESQEFSLAVPRDLGDVRLDFVWTLDGERVSTAESFKLVADDPRLVRDGQVQVVGTAADPKGRADRHEWRFDVIPPAPRIVGSSPPADATVDVDRAGTVELSVSEPIGDQTFTYIFDVDGRQERSGKPTHRVTTGGGEQSRVIAWVTDNYGQRSTERSWTFRPTTIVGQVERWLEDYRQAFNRKDLERLRSMLRLDADKAAVQRQTLECQRNLNVTFEGLGVEKIDTNRARASYTRTDQFTDCNTGAARSLSTAVKQQFRLVNGRIELERTER